MVSLLQDIIMGVNIGHDREWWTTPRSLSGGRMVLPLDFVADDLNGFIFYNHQEYECWKEGIAISLQRMRPTQFIITVWIEWLT